LTMVNQEKPIKSMTQINLIRFNKFFLSSYMIIKYEDQF